MSTLAYFAASVASTLGAVHLSTAVITARRQRQKVMPLVSVPPITVIRPLKGAEPFSYLTLKSTFDLAPAARLILFCVDHTDDAVVPLVERLIDDHPSVDARLVIGRDVVSANPKLNNIVKGWRETETDWVAVIDSNALLPSDMLGRLWAGVDERVGLVSSPPVGSAPLNFAAQVECAFLNGYQARWQSAADAFGNGFAQGKVLFLNRAVVERGGGIVSLGAEAAEDAAATKLVRAQGLNVRLVHRFVEQPIGTKTLKQVWDRQLRWAKLRRSSFPFYFAAEILSGGLMPTVLAYLAALSLNGPAMAAALVTYLLWYLTEDQLARAAGWPRSILANMLRDLMLPIIWVGAWLSNDFTWQGHNMQAKKDVSSLSPQPSLRP
jgi:ceramide glucosyltransferase